VDAGIDARVALKTRVHIWKQLHLEGSVQARWLDSNTRSSAMVDDSMEYMAYIGFGFFEEPIRSYLKKHPSGRSPLNAKPYIRVAQGWGNDSTLAQIFNGDIRKDDVAVNMTSVFYGHPLSDTLFTLPIETYFTPGVVHHYSSSAQDSATEFVLGVKFFYTIPTPWRVRLGAAEGISYIDSFTYYEENSLNDSGLIPSRLLNYVDLSVDLNIGDIFCSKPLEDLWLGYGIHHRSGIGGTSPTFGNISGGSNYNTVYLQWSGKF
jgi:outer membrane protein